MNEYGIFRGEVWLENIHADNEADALQLAKHQHGEGVRVELVSEVGPHGKMI